MPFSITINYITPPTSPTPTESSEEENEDLTDPVFMNLIDEFFRRCREKGIFCAKDWSCCQSCGHTDMENLGHQNYIFYHQQDGDRLRDGDLECHFAFHFESENRRTDVKELVDEFGGVWDGGNTTRILLRLSPVLGPPSILQG
jgi:hypothetical protein